MDQKSHQGRRHPIIVVHAPQMSHGPKLHVSQHHRDPHHYHVLFTTTDCNCTYNYMLATTTTTDNYNYNYNYTLSAEVPLEVLQLQFIEGRRQFPVFTQRLISHGPDCCRTKEIPQLQYIDTVADFPVVRARAVSRGADCGEDIRAPTVAARRIL